MELNSVVLPEPLGPISPVMPPRSHRQRHRMVGDDAAVGFGHVLELDDRAAHSAPSGCGSSPTSTAGFRRAFVATARHEQFRIFFGDPADDTLLEVDDGDDDEHAERDELPAEEIGPGHFLDGVENHRADHRSPQRSLAAQQHHHHHEQIEGGDGKGDVARLDESVHVAEDGAGDAEEDRRKRPGRALVAAGMQSHGFRFFLVVADGVER